MATKTDNTLWAWGAGAYGKLAQNDTTSRSSPTQIPGSWANLMNQGNDPNFAFKNI